MAFHHLPYHMIGVFWINDVIRLNNSKLHARKHLNVCCRYDVYFQIVRESLPSIASTARYVIDALQQRYLDGIIG